MIVLDWELLILAYSKQRYFIQFAENFKFLLT